MSESSLLFGWVRRSVFLKGAAAVFFAGVVFLGIQRWCAVAALQRAAHLDDCEIQINLTTSSEIPPLMPEFIFDATGWILDRHYRESLDNPGFDLEKKRARMEQKIHAFFLGRITELWIDMNRGFDESLGEEIARFSQLEELVVDQASTWWRKSDMVDMDPNILDPGSIGWLEPRNVRKLMEALPRLKHLRLLCLKGDWVGDEEVRHLKTISSLQTLVLARCPITAECFDTFFTLPNLKELDVSDTWITDEEAERLSSLLPGVNVYHQGLAPR
jgi:hypothetical protein